MVFHSKTKGIDEIEMVKETFQHRYPTITFFEIDELVSLPFIKHLLTKNIVLFGICGYTHNYNGTFQLLLLPYEKKIDRSNRRAYEPVPTGTVECE